MFFKKDNSDATVFDVLKQCGSEALVPILEACLLRSNKHKDSVRQVGSENSKVSQNEHGMLSKTNNSKKRKDNSDAESNIPKKNKPSNLKR